MAKQQLFLIHCGFYDLELLDGIYESHVNLFVAAESMEDARLKVKQLPEYKQRKMHVDGIQQIEAVQGYRLELQEDSALEGQTLVHSNRHRELAPNAPKTLS